MTNCENFDDGLTRVAPAGAFKAVDNPTQKIKEIENTDSYLSDDWILKMFEDWFDPCPYNDSPNEDGLKLEWKDKTYVNPPYSNPLPWVEKAIEESKKGKMIVMLLKMDTSTKAFMKLKETNAHFLWINGRLRYRKISYKYFKNTPLPFPSMLVVLDGEKLN